MKRAIKKGRPRTGEDTLAIVSDGGREVVLVGGGDGVVVMDGGDG